MEEQAKKLMERFAEAKLPQAKEYEFRVYLMDLDENNKHLLKNGKLAISNPSPFSGMSPAAYFVAEVNLRLFNRGGWLSYKHSFQLDLTQLKIEMEKIDSENSLNLIAPDRVANVFGLHYHEMAPFLIDFNGDKDNYAEIARFIISRLGSGIRGEYER